MVRKAEFLPAQTEDIIETFEFNPEETRTEFDEKIDSFASAMRDLGDNSEILVKRQTGTGQEPMEHVGYFQPDEFTYGQLVEHLRKNYGGGLYRIYLRANGKNKGNSLVRIAAPKESPINSPTVGGEVSHVLAQILAPIREQQKQLLDFMQRGQAQPSRREMLEEMVMYKELFGGGGKTDGLSQLNEVLELLPKLGVTINQGGAEEEDSFVKIIERFTPLMSNALEAQQNQQSVYKENPAPRENPKMFAQFALKSGIKMALKAAAKKSDPSLYAEMLIDQLGDETVKKYLLDPNFANKLLAIEPKIAEFAKWFDEMAEHAKGMIGMQSAFSSLYQNGENDITGETDSDADNAADIHPTEDS